MSRSFVALIACLLVFPSTLAAQVVEPANDSPPSAETDPLADGPEVPVDDVEIPDEPVTPEEFELFSEWDVPSVEPAQLNLGLDDGPLAQGRAITPLGPYKWYLLGKKDQRKKGVADEYTGRQLVMLRNKPGAFVIEYGLGTGGANSRFDVRWNYSDDWYGGFAYGAFDGCGWLQAIRVKDPGAEEPQAC